MLSKEYYRPVDTTALVNRGLTQVVASLNDPYSHYYDPSQYDSFQQLTDPHLSGIGVDVIGTHAGREDPAGLQRHPGRPGGADARRSDHRGRRAVAVGAAPQAQRQPATKLIKGTAGTNVTLTVLRDGHTLTEDADARQRDRAGGAAANC